MGTEATQWQMFQQISLYNKKLGQNCRKGCFLKKHTDFKETSGGICNIYRAVPAEGAGLQARGRSGQAMMGACSRGLEQHLGCSKLARTVWKSSCGASNFDFTELRRGGGARGETQAVLKSSRVLAHVLSPQSLRRATLSCRIERTLQDSLALSTGLSLWGWAKIQVGNCCKESKIRNIRINLWKLHIPFPGKKFPRDISP